MPAPLAEQLADLQLRARAAAWPGLDGDAVRHDLVARAADMLAGVRAGGESVRLDHADGRVRAWVGTRYDDDTWFGAPAQYVDAAFDADDTEAAAFAAEHVERFARAAGDDLDVTVEAAHAATLVPALLSAGARVGSVLLMGDVTCALAALGEVDVAARLEAAGVALRTARRDDVAAMVEIHRRAFTEAREYCHFGANPAFLVRLADDLARECGETPAPWVVERRGHVAGWINASAPRNAAWGHSGGMGVFLQPELRRLGLARALYAVCLASLRDAGIPWFRGGTSQPAILKLGAQMGRACIAWHVRRDGAFDPGHFAPYDPVAPLHPTSP